MTTRLVRALGKHPLVPVAVKTAVAAVLAWLVVRPLGGSADDYSYYAPLGAVVAVSSRLGQSLRATLETVLAIGLGAGLALGVRAVPVSEIVGLGLVVGIGTLVGAWRWVGSMATWVPISALFILILGGPHPFGYVLAYIGLTGIGAVIGVVVNVLAPPLPMIATRSVQASLRDVLVAQLDGLADGLERDPLPTTEEWRRGEEKLVRLSERAEDLMGQVRDSSQINWRVRRNRDEAEREARQGRALNQLTFLVQEMIALLAHQENADRSLVALGADLRPPAAAAFRAAAGALRSVEQSVAGVEELTEANRAADDLAQAVSDWDGDGETFAAASLVTAIRRVLDSVSPEPVETARSS